MLTLSFPSEMNNEFCPQIVSLPLKKKHRDMSSAQRALLLIQVGIAFELAALSVGARFRL
jgi:hypothetical protein